MLKIAYDERLIRTTKLHHTIITNAAKQIKRRLDQSKLNKGYGEVVEFDGQRLFVNYEFQEGKEGSDKKDPVLVIMGVRYIK